MAGYTTVNSFFDESGKFNDHKVVCFGGVASYAEHLDSFSKQWERLLSQNGLKELSAKRILNANRPLSSKNQDVGVKNRIGALLPFIHSIRKDLLVVTGVAISVPAFKKLPSHFYKFFGPNPIYMAFARAMLHVVEFTPSNDKISFICDDEEQIAWEFYRLYRRIKKVWPNARKKLAGISFVDDKFLFGLQAADFVAALIRHEAGRIWHRKPYDYRPLYKALTQEPEKHERLMICDIAFGNKSSLVRMADGLQDEWKRVQREAKERGMSEL
jgi:hypothetical protein